MPDGLNPLEAGALPLVLTTGAQLIENGINPRPGQRLLVTGALGGVGRTAVHVAKTHGAHVIAAVRASQRSEAEKWSGRNRRPGRSKRTGQPQRIRLSSRYRWARRD